MVYSNLFSIIWLTYMFINSTHLMTKMFTKYSYTKYSHLKTLRNHCSFHWKFRLGCVFQPWIFRLKHEVSSMYLAKHLLTWYFVNIARWIFFQKLLPRGTPPGEKVNVTPCFCRVLSLTSRWISCVTSCDLKALSVRPLSWNIYSKGVKRVSEPKSYLVIQCSTIYFITRQVRRMFAYLET